MPSWCSFDFLSTTFISHKYNDSFIFDNKLTDHSPKCGDQYPYPSLFRTWTTEVILDWCGWVERGAGMGRKRKCFEIKRRERKIDGLIWELKYGTGTGRLEIHGAAEWEFSLMGYLLSSRRTSYTAANVIKRLSLSNLLQQKRRLEEGLTNRRLKRVLTFQW